VKVQTQQQKEQETKVLQWRNTPTYESLNPTTKITIATKTTTSKTYAMKKNHNITIKTTINKSYLSIHDNFKQTSMTSKYKGCMKPLHLQDHKN
jgi:hypothetical protein